MTESRGLSLDQSAKGTGLSLTSDHLHSLPKRNLGQFLLQYIQSQRRFLKSYASEGEAGPTSWNRLGTDPDQHLPHLVNPSASGELDNLVFGTPILKARVPTPYAPVDAKSRGTAKNRETSSEEPATQNHAPPPRKSQVDEVPANTTKPGHKSAELRKPNGKLLKAPTTAYICKEKESKSNKRTRNTDENRNSDHEQADRLADRRNRKRVRKDIMKPHVSNKEDQEGSREQSKKSKNQSKSVQAGFALMHGFSATNVGKNRLTLDPLFRNLGVFKKGKASNATRVAGKKAVKQDSRYIFSESKFLNSKKTRPISPAASVSSTLSSTGSESSLKSHNSPSHSTKNNSVKGDEEEVKSIMDKPTRPLYNPDGSIIWDIEKESKSSTDSAPSERQATIMVHLPLELAPNQPSKENHARTGDSQISVDSSGEKRCASPSVQKPPSLGPSQSASQILPQIFELEGKKLALLNGNGTSKYFKPVLEKPNIVPTDHTVSPGKATSTEPLNESLYIDRKGSSGKRCNHAMMDLEPVFANADCTYDSLETLGENNASAGYCNEGTTAEPHMSIRPENVCSLDSYFFLPPTAWGASGALSGHYDNIYDAREDTWLGIEDTIDSEIFQVDHHGDELIGSSVINDYAIIGSNLLDDVISEPLLEDPPGRLEDSCAGFSAQEPCLSADHEVDFYPDVYNPYEIEDLQPFNYDNLPEGEACLVVGDLESPRSNISPNDLGQDDWTQNDGFYQGRCLLYGLNTQPENVSGSHRISFVEAEVAGLLKQNHWLPQRL